MIDPRLLQLSDSAFPSGAFSHSFGLETAIAEGRVTDVSTLTDWLDAYLAGSYAPFDARAVVLGVRTTADWSSIDRCLSASLFANDVRSGTRRLARATLDAYRAMGLASAAIDAYRAAIAGDEGHGHHPLACALGYAAIGASERDAVVAHGSGALAALTSVAARTVPLGQREIGALLWSLRDRLGEIAATAILTRSADDLAANAFGAEIDAMRHERLDARVFAS